MIMSVQPVADLDDPNGKSRLSVISAFPASKLAMFKVDCTWLARWTAHFRVQNAPPTSKSAPLSQPSVVCRDGLAGTQYIIARNHGGRDCV